MISNVRNNVQSTTNFRAWAYKKPIGSKGTTKKAGDILEEKETNTLLESLLIAIRGRRVKDSIELTPDHNRIIINNAEDKSLTIVHAGEDNKKYNSLFSQAVRALAALS